MKTNTKHLSADYLLGSLKGADRKRFEKALKKGDRQLLQDLAEMQEVWAAVGYAAEPVLPSPAVKEKLLARISVGGTEGSRNYHVLFEQALAQSRRLAAAAVIIALLSAGQVYYILHLKETVDSQKTVMTAMQFELAAAKRELAEKESILRTVRSSFTRVVSLHPVPGFPDGNGKILWNQKTNEAVFLATGLRSAPSYKEWELWIIQDKKPVSMGVFYTDENGQIMITFKQVPHPEKSSIFAVTLEPKGGKPEPEGDLYIIGSL